MDFGAWLVETYGQDLSGVTEIKEVPSDVTGALLFSRSKEKRLSFFLFFTDDAIEVLAETITSTPNFNCSSTGSFESLSVLVNLRSINLRGCTKIDRSRAFELLASWDWAAQLESLEITGVEGELK